MFKFLKIWLKFGLNSIKQNVTKLKKNILYKSKVDKNLKKNNNNFRMLIEKKFEIATKLRITYKKNNLKSVVISRISSNRFKPSYFYIICRFKYEKIIENYVKGKVLKQWVQSKYNKNTKKYYKLIDIILDVEFLQKCYFYINSKSISLTPLIDDKILNGVHKKLFTTISNRIKNRTYMWKSSRVIYISKSGITKTIRLITNSSRNTIIQEGIRKILLTIYEPKFSNYSYGFRQGKSPHYALRQVKNWHHVSWLLCLDTEKYFDSINKKLLINIIKKDIDDQRFFNIMYELLKNNIFEMRLKKNFFIEEVFQESILLPILLNIYLNVWSEVEQSNTSEIVLPIQLGKNLSTRLLLVTKGLKLWR